jgi:hypothetical protein
MSSPIKGIIEVFSTLKIKKNLRKISQKVILKRETKSQEKKPGTILKNSKTIRTLLTGQKQFM